MSYWSDRRAEPDTATRSPTRRRGVLGTAAVGITVAVTVVFGGIAHAQSTDLAAEIDVATDTLRINLAPGEPWPSPSLSILFSPGISAGDASSICLDAWNVETVALTSHDPDTGTSESDLESQRFTCQVDDAAQNDSLTMEVPIVVTEAAALRPMSATVGIESAAMLLETTALPTTTSEFVDAVCDPNGLTVNGSEEKEASDAPANGIVAGYVEHDPASTAQPVQLVGVDSCNQWISRSVAPTGDGMFSFSGLLPGKYALGIRGSKLTTAVSLTRDRARVFGITL
ncbi:hypothetical protein O4220_05050 [Rhodococcus ruber]|uniref:Uncharacterized protein n=1 Tax=Rhodococcus ruber TaxID=1830 RepID=A0ABT4MDR5_9NOCA|nr:hypothetical protein [Rhodococcus ruber]MCZ4517876.1 hypothetical protein [Rhodococcus ruber]